MIRKILFIIFLFVSTLSSFAQISSEKLFRFDKSFYDTSNNVFFAQHPDICYLEVRYNYNNPVAIYIYRKNTSTQHEKMQSQYVIDESYDLEFLGDKYLFISKYGNMKLPFVPVSVIEKIDNASKCKEGEGRNAWLSAIVYRDSTIYRFKQECKQERKGLTFISPGVGTPPKYFGNISFLQKVVEKNCSNRTKFINDSIFIFWGKVSNVGILSNLTLLVGTKSYFSDCLKQQIEKQENKWAPADVSGKKMNGYIRILVRLNNEKSVNILTPGRLLIASGK